MNATGTITMTMRELDRFKVVQSVADGLLKPWRAAQRLGLTTRQVRRLVARVREAGPAGLVSGRYAKPSNNRLDAVTATRAVAIIRERYADFGPTLACEKLRECHGLRLAKETVRRLMIDADLWIPRRQRPPKIHQLRSRRACVGELVQIDGSDHRWFEDRAPACTLLVYVDDATSRLMALHFTATESTFSYFEATRGYLERHGKPVAFYSDKASVFRATQAATTAGKGFTQYGRALYELNIESWCANSSQAKRRVERADLTLQDRFVKELRLRGISTLIEANAYAPSFIADFNRRFGKPPRSDHDAHRPLRADEDLRQILVYRVPRKVTNSLTVQYDRVMYLMEDSSFNHTLHKPSPFARISAAHVDVHGVDCHPAFAGHQGLNTLLLTYSLMDLFMSIRAQDVVPISVARARLTELAEDVVAGAEKILTKNGSAYVALVDARKLDYYHALEAEHGRLVMLDDAEKGLRDALAGRVQSEEKFRKSLRRSGSRK